MSQPAETRASSSSVCGIGIRRSRSGSQLRTRASSRSTESSSTRLRIVKAREEVDSRIAQLDGAGLRSSALYAGLLEKARELRTLEALQTSNARVVRQADRAVKILRTRADLVLIDLPPLLHAADSMALDYAYGRYDSPTTTEAHAARAPVP